MLLRISAGAHEGSEPVSGAVKSSADTRQLVSDDNTVGKK